MAGRNLLAGVSPAEIQRAASGGRNLLEGEDKAKIERDASEIIRRDDARRQQREAPKPKPQAPARSPLDLGGERRPAIKSASDQFERRQADPVERERNLTDPEALRPAERAGVIARAGDRMAELEQQGYLGQQRVKFGQMGLGLAGGLARTVTGVGGRPDEGIVLPGDDFVYNTLIDFARTSEAITSRPVAGTTTWEDVKNDPTQVGKFILDEGPASLAITPLMLTPAGQVGLGLSFTGQIAQERAQNNNREDANLGDVMIAAPFAAGSVALERAGIESIFRPGVGNVAMRIGKAGAGEALTEGVQGVVEGLGGSLGTERGVEWREIADRAAAGTVVGFGAGAGFRGGIELVDGTGRLVRRRAEDRRLPAPGNIEAAVEAAATPTQADIDSPLDTGDIAEGKAIIAQAGAEKATERELSLIGMPNVGQRVTITDPELGSQSGTMRDRFTGPDGSGVVIELDDGKIMREFDDTLADLGISITAEGPLAEADAIDAQLAAQAQQAISSGAPGSAAGEAPPSQPSPSPAAGDGGAPVRASGKRGEVAGVLGQAGYSPAVVAGFLGNFEVEGGYEGARGDGGSASGIAQWRNERRDNFRRQFGKEPHEATAAEQARFVVWEMSNPAAAGMTPAQRDRILAAKTPEEAAELIDQFYERSDGKARARRAEEARRFAGDMPVGAAPEEAADPSIPTDRRRAMLEGETARLPEGQRREAETIDRESIMAAASRGGELDGQAAGEFVRARVAEALNAGGSVDLIVEGRRRSIRTADLVDDRGQRWGIMPILQPAQGDRARLEISYPDAETTSRDGIASVEGAGLLPASQATEAQAAQIDETPAVQQDAPPTEPAAAPFPADQVQISAGRTDKSIMLINPSEATIAMLRSTVPQAKATPRDRDGNVSYPKKYEEAIRAAIAANAPSAEGESVPVRDLRVGDVIDLAGEQLRVVDMRNGFPVLEDGFVLARADAPPAQVVSRGQRPADSPPLLDQVEAEIADGIADPERRKDVEEYLTDLSDPDMAATPEINRRAISALAKLREQQDGAAQGDEAGATPPKSRQVAEQAEPLPTEETRGKGVQYHGARGEVPDFKEGYYNPANIYGGFDTFYTTDAVSIASGYQRRKKGGITYRIEEVQPVTTFDMEERLSPEEIWSLFNSGTPWSEADGFPASAVEEATGSDGLLNLREAMDEARDQSRAEGYSRDETQEIFDNVIYNLRQRGFGAMRHIGGLKTGKEPHNVKIYFDAPNQLRLIPLRAAEQNTAEPQDGEVAAPVEASEGSGADVAPADSAASAGGAVNPIPARTEDRSDVAVTATGTEIPVTYAVVEMADLVTSNTPDGAVNPAYPADRQPRDRTRVASQAQIAEIASRLNPRLLGRSAKASDGAPIISPDGIVESGNGRTLALQRVYAEGGESAQAYRQFVESEGFDVSGMEQPVLVRIRDENLTPDQVQEFVRAANVRDTAGMSGTETAASDAAAMPSQMVDLYRGGDIDAAGNRDFVRAFVNELVPTNERASMILADGSIAKPLVARIEAALLVRAFGERPFIEKLVDATDSNIRAIGKALVEMAGKFAKLREATQDGRVDPAMDITGNIAEAVEIVDRARREGKPVADYVNQRDIFSGTTVAQLTEASLHMFFSRPNFTKPHGQARLVSIMDFYVEEAMKAAPGGGLFGESTKATPDGIIGLANERNAPTQAAGTDLFTANREPGDGADGASVREAGGDGGLAGEGVQEAAGAQGEGSGAAVAEAAPEAAEPTVQPVSRETFQNWKRSVNSVGTTLGWTIFDDTDVGGSFVLMNDAERVGPFANETAARAWASENSSRDMRPSAAQPTRIDDFGEKLEGARKDYASRMAKAKEADVASVPLSQSWPEPDYVKLIESGADTYVVAWVRAARDEIPTKPQKGWKLKGWVENVQMLRDFAEKLLAGDVTAEDIRKKMNAEFSRSLRDLQGRVDLYEAVGHERSLKGITLSFHHYSLYRGRENVDLWAVEQKAKATAFSNWPREIATGDTKQEAIDKFKAALASGAIDPKAKRTGPRFEIYSYRNKPGKFIIGVKVGRNTIDLREFDTVKEARDYRISGEGDAWLQAEFAKFKDVPDHRRRENSPRIGINHRAGADVTPEQFQEAFGFRGVQFGNYVEGARRQEDLNEAYDALMDLAGIIGVPSQALSLNGELGLAFGARGKGGKRAAAAHYEPGTIVINLTKGRGAGSLAHEWWHSLDNYFSRMRSDPDGYMTARPYERGAGVRPEMVEAFAGIMRAIKQTRLRERSKNLDKRRTKEYWSTDIEMSARAFESYVIAKLQDEQFSNDYLANIVSEEAWQIEDGYPYLTAGEIAPVRAAFDAFFDTVETRETERGLALAENQQEAYDDGRDTPDPQERDPAATVRGDSDTLPARERDAGRPRIPGEPDRGRVRVRELGIAAEIQRAGTASLVGREVTAPSELAELAQIHRDPRYETFRVFFMRGNEIVHASAVTARLSNQTPLLPEDGPPERFYGWLRETMASSGADGYYLLHNHPSGNPDPSKPDVDVTRRVAEAVPGFRSHVVINSGRFAFITAEGGTKVRDLARGEDALLTPSKPGPLLGQRVSNQQELAQVAKVAQQPGYVTVIGTNQSAVRVIVDVPVGQVQRSAKYLAGLMRRIMRMSGADNLFLVGDPNVVFGEKPRAAFDERIITEIISTDGVPLGRTMSPRERESLFNREAQGLFVAEEGEVFDATDEPYQLGPSKFAIPERTQAIILAGQDPTWRGKMERAFNEFRRAAQDRYLPLLRVQRDIELRQGAPLPPEMNPYLGEELSAGRMGARLEELMDERVRPLFDAMADEGVTTDELESYLYARHAPERNARIAEINPDFTEGTGSGMTDLEARAIMARITKQGKMDAMKRLARRVDEIRDETLARRVEYGLMSQKEANEWRSTYENYVPLRGFAETGADPADAARINRSGGGINVRGKESKAAFGRRSVADSPLAYLILQAEEAIVRGETNRVAQRFVSLAEANPDQNFWQVNKVTSKKRINPDTGLVEDYIDTQLTAADRDWTVVAKFDGKERRVTMNRANPEARALADAMRNLTQHQLDFVTKYVGAINRFLSKINTSYNPEFLIANAVRDVQTASLNLTATEQKGLVTDTLKNYRAALVASTKGAFGNKSGEWGKWYREFMEDGGRVYFNQVEDVELIKKRMRRVAEQVNAARGAKDVRLQAKRMFRAAVDTIENVNLGVENAIRLAAYKAGRDRGMTREQAASLAKNLTVNFNRRGTFGPIVNSLYLFFNASVQGSVRMLQAVRSRRLQKVLAGVALSAAMLELLNAMVSGDDEDGESYYDKIAPYEKRTNMIIMLPDGKSYVKLPLPYGFNTFFAAGRTAAEIARRGGDRWKESAADLLTTALEAFNPIGFDFEGRTGWEALVSLVTPSMLDPVVDLSQNRNFMGKPILPEKNPYGPSEPEHQRYFGGVGTYWVGLSEILNTATGGDDVREGAVSISPGTFEYLFGTVVGAAGSFVDRIASIPTKVNDPTYDFGPRDVPFARKVVGGPDPWYDKGAYYERVGTIEAAIRDTKDYLDREQFDDALQYAEAKAAILSMEPAMKAAEKEMRRLRKAKRENESLYEREQIDQATYNENRALIRDREDEIVTAFNSIWNQTVESGREFGAEE